MASLPGHLGLLSKACQELFRPHVAAGAIGPADLDPKIVTDLDAMPEASALICCERFLSSNVFGIRNKSGFMVGIMRKFKQESEHNGGLDARGGAGHWSSLPPSHAAGHGDPAKTIWVGNLPPGATNANLRSIFEELGTIFDLRVSAVEGTYAFVEFESRDVARAALGLDGTSLGESRLSVSPANPDRQAARGVLHEMQRRAVERVAEAVKPLVPDDRVQKVGGVVGPAQLSALASITSPAALAALNGGKTELNPAPNLDNLNPAERRAALEARGAVWGTMRRRSPGSSASRSRSRSRSANGRPPVPKFRSDGTPHNGGAFRSTKQCYYHDSRLGCRNGDACKFMHGPDDARRGGGVGRLSAKAGSADGCGRPRSKV